MSMELIQAGAEHQSVLENLLQFYMHDFSELIALEVNSDGRFTYKNLSLFWSDPSRLPFLARFDGNLAGLALVTRISEPGAEHATYDMTEFFVLRRYRHRGVGREMARHVWLRCPGRWQVRVMSNNVAALQFWASSIADFTQRTADFFSREIDGTKWQVFSFDSRR